MGSKQEVKDLESFIIKARKIHGDSYDYSKVVYTKACNKVIIRCIKHDYEFHQTINSHTSSKSGCPLCALERLGKSFKKPLSYYLDKANAVHDGKYDYSLVKEVKTSKDKVEIICPTHGVFIQELSAHTLGRGCGKCSKERVSASARLSTEVFLGRATEIHGDRYDYSLVELEKSHSYIDIICKLHGPFTQRADHHLTTEGCPKCVAITKGDLYRFTKEEFVSRAKEVHGDTYDYSLVNYFNSQTKIDIICRQHGVFSQVPNSHLYVGGCPVCSTQKVGYRANIKGYFYILKVTDDIYKFGITNNFNKRVKGINSKSIFDIEPLYLFSSDDGYVIRKLESEIISSDIERKVVDKGDMLSGYTETFYSKDLSKVLDIVYKHFPPA